MSARRPGHVRHQGGQPVVVAEPDLVGGHRVVLVDHRQHAQLEQPVQGALRVAVVGPAHQVVGGQQDLAGADAVPGEGGGVPGDEQALADAGRGLLGGQVAGAAREPQRDQAGRDRARGDQDDLRGRGPAAARAAFGEGLSQGGDCLVVDLAVRRGQGRGTDLDHDAGRCGDVRPHRNSRGSVPRGPRRCLRWPCLVCVLARFS